MKLKSNHVQKLYYAFRIHHPYFLHELYFNEHFHVFFLDCIFLFFFEKVSCMIFLFCFQLTLILKDSFVSIFVGCCFVGEGVWDVFVENTHTVVRWCQTLALTKPSYKLLGLWSSTSSTRFWSQPQDYSLSS